MRIHFLQSVLGLTVLGAALVACGDDSSSGTGGAGTGGSDTTATGSPTTDASSTATGVGPTTTSTSTGNPTTTTGGGTCEISGFFTDPDTDACGQENCCDELVACDPNVDPTACFNPDDGTFDNTLPAGAALEECMTQAGCFGAAICDSGIGFGEDPDQATLDFAICLSENCCEEFNFCTGNGEDADACISCLNGEEATFDLCEPANQCALDNCEQGLVFVPICESGLGTSDIESGQCANDNCCDEYTACTGGDANDEEAVQACLDCLIDGGGALCDDAIACEDEFCSTAVCDSGIAFNDIETAACLTANCCDEYTACAGGDPNDEEAVQACIDCFVAEGGALCDDAIACTDQFCGDGAGGGGTGGGAGTGGAGGAG